MHGDLRSHWMKKICCLHFFCLIKSLNPKIQLEEGGIAMQKTKIKVP